MCPPQPAKSCTQRAETENTRVSRQSMQSIIWSKHSRGMFLKRTSVRGVKASRNARGICIASATESNCQRLDPQTCTSISLSQTILCSHPEAPRNKQPTTESACARSSINCGETPETHPNMGSMQCAQLCRHALQKTEHTSQKLRDRRQRRQPSKRMSHDPSPSKS